MTVLLTGANGFVGFHVIEALLARGDRVRAWVRPSSDAEHLTALGVEVARGSFDDPDALDAALPGVRALVHCAGGGKVAGPDGFAAANTETTRALIAAVLRTGVSLDRFVLLSSLSAHGPAGAAPASEEDEARPVSDYGRSKLEAERLLQAELTRVPSTILRPPAVYGPRDTRMVSLFKSVKRGVLPRLGAGGQTSVLWGPDCARAILAAIDTPHASGRIFHVADGRAYTHDAMGAAIEEAFGVRARRLPVPRPILGAVAIATELYGRVTGRAVVLTRDKVADLSQDSWVTSVDRIQRELGWSPSVEFEEGAQLTARWYEAHGWC